MKDEVLSSLDCNIKWGNSYIRKIEFSESVDFFIEAKLLPSHKLYNQSKIIAEDIGVYMMILLRFPEVQNFQTNNSEDLPVKIEFDDEEPAQIFAIEGQRDKFTVYLDLGNQFPSVESLMIRSSFPEITLMNYLSS